MSNATDAAPAGAMNWFEPPTCDIGASLSFYERALETYLTGDDDEAARGVSFGGDAIAYCAVLDIAAAIASRTAAGGKALTDIIDLPAGIGRIAHMLDADGGRIGLHQLMPRA